MKNTLRHSKFITGSALWRLALVLPISALGLAGCSDTGKEVATGPSAATSHLAYVSDTDSLVQKGATKEAVRAAWGKPSRVSAHETRRGMQEIWTYTQTHHGHGGGYFGIPRGWVHDKRGSHYNSDSYYPAPHSSQTLGNNPTTEVPIRRVTFEGGVAVNVEVRHHHGSHEERG